MLDILARWMNAGAGDDLVQAGPGVALLGEQVGRPRRSAPSQVLEGIEAQAVQAVTNLNAVLDAAGLPPPTWPS